MPAREVSDEERLALVRRNLKNAAEITEAFRAAFEDGIPLSNESAVEMLEELRNCIDSAYVDAFPEDDPANSVSFDVVCFKRPVRLSENTVDDEIS